MTGSHSWRIGGKLAGMKSTTIATLGDLRDGHYTVYAHCSRHSTMLDLDALIDRLGAGFVFYGNPNPLAARLRCERCGDRAMGIVVSPPHGRVG